MFNAKHGWCKGWHGEQCPGARAARDLDHAAADTLAGGAMMPALTTPASRRVDLAGNTGRYATRLVDFLLSEKLRR
jgi:hypothetical protein